MSRKFIKSSKPAKNDIYIRISQVYLEGINYFKYKDQSIFSISITDLDKV